MFNTLLVEDNVSYRQTLADVLLVHFPFIGVDEAGDGNEALSKVGYLRPAKDNRDVLQMWVWEVDTGKSRLLLKAEDVVGKKSTELTDEEILALERKRITERGITSFVWSPDGHSVLLPLGGGLYLYDQKTKENRTLDDGASGAPPAA